MDSDTEEMKTNGRMNSFIYRPRTRFCLAVCIIVLTSGTLCGHNWTVHTNITGSAFASSDGLAAFLSDFLENTNLTANPRQSGGTFVPAEWLWRGCKYEDEETQWFLGPRTPRCVDHFYWLTTNRIPGQVIGMSDDTEGPLINEATGIGPRPLPKNLTNSFAWAAWPGIPGPKLATIEVGTNKYNWPCARNFEFEALTNSSRSARGTNMAMMLYALGHVLHLNQDLSQPDHVRNDNHNFDDRRYIENYGDKNHLINPGWFALQPRGWSYWRTNGFLKLLDFWDTGNYTDDSAILNQEALGHVKLGLAEFSNGNFLGEDALYNESIPVTDPFHHFPYPSLFTSTTFPLVRSKLASGTSTSFLKNGRAITNITIGKTGDGVQTTNHSVMKYLGTKFPKKGGAVVSAAFTLNDANVLQDYHAILIPKAVEYSAGILDYFFRGKLGVTFGPGGSQSTLGLTITNASGVTLQGGEFKLFSDDVAGTRTELASFSTPYTTSSSLVDGATTTAEFTPTNGAVQYVLVYRGTIGAGNSTALDPVDANIAIAATRLCCVPDAGPSVPSPLKQDDDAVFGPVSVSDTTPVSAGYLSPGDYQIEYLDGVLDVWVDSSPDSHIAYVTYFISSPLGDSNVVIGVKSSGSGYLPGVAGESLGVYSTIDDIEDATLDQNPMTAFGWSGGEFFMFGSIEFGPEFFFGSSTSARYQIRRTAKPYAEPDRVRIKDWDALVKPQISTCSTCPNSSASEWGGTFPEQDGDWDLPHWTDSGAVALKGKAMGYPEIQYGATCWRLFFVCSNGDVIWSGRKDVGTDPTGTYIQDLDDAPDQCSVDLKCVVVESY